MPKQRWPEALGFDPDCTRDPKLCGQFFEMERKASPCLLGCVLCSQGYGGESHVWMKEIFGLSSLTLQGLGVQTEGGFREDPFLPCAFPFRREIPIFLCLSMEFMSLGKLLLYRVYENLLCRHSTAELWAQGWAGTKPVLDHLVQLLQDVESLLQFHLPFRMTSCVTIFMPADIGLFPLETL